ncbi:uncharacterized protein LOC115752894 [Rhodamnia argentea]|uniref:Uncharacterized protein LOC115752894 n=1 Tax=Rhodamnia argentea TaxID=178133 RepID=A0A8B8QJ52_9MYRT|nr:uncharacterized protein LOC115752894 [Rhodamnia argentea]
MASHKDKNLLESEPPLVIDNSSEEGRRLGYCLRENPKKSWKFLELKEDAPENPCLVCDKRFRSMRALLCHMKIHPGKDDESGDRGKGSRSRKSCQDHTRSILGRKRLNSSLLNEDRFVGSSKTESGLLVAILSDDEAMRITRRKRTPRVEIDVDARTEGVPFPVPNGSSDSNEAEQDLGSAAAVTLIMMCRGETDSNSLGLGVETLGKSSAPGFYDVGKGKITEASECNESHSRGHSRVERKGAELEVSATMLCGAREVERKKPEAARSGKEPMYEVAMMDCDAMGTAGSHSRERAELWIEPGINSHRGKVCVEECQVFRESGEKNEYKSRDAESYKQESPVGASQGIEGSRVCAELASIKDDSEKVSSQGMYA